MLIREILSEMFTVPPLEEATRINDDWFKSGAFKTWKNPTPVHYELAASPGTVETLEGPMRYAAGHYIMTGPKGERYPITAEKFEQLYDDNGSGTATPKRVEKTAKVADHDGVLHTNWGDLSYTTGNDYIVKHGPNDYGAVKADILAKTYHLPGGPQDTMAEAEVWDKPNPVKKHKHLSPERKSAARARAKRAGRKYPNMIDNIWAARKK
jgi:hypothetical protein